MNSGSGTYNQVSGANDSGNYIQGTGGNTSYNQSSGGDGAYGQQTYYSGQGYSQPPPPIPPGYAKVQIAKCK